MIKPRPARSNGGTSNPRSLFARSIGICGSPRSAIVTDRMELEIAGFRETGFRIHEQTKFVFLVRISEVEEVLAVFCNRHHGPQVYGLA